VWIGSVNDERQMAAGADPGVRPGTHQLWQAAWVAWNSRVRPRVFLFICSRLRRRQGGFQADMRPPPSNRRALPVNPRHHK
jgi:hypothetical protein